MPKKINELEREPCLISENDCRFIASIALVASYLREPGAPRTASSPTEVPHAFAQRMCANQPGRHHPVRLRTAEISPAFQRWESNQRAFLPCCRRDGTNLEFPPRLGAS